MCQYWYRPPSQANKQVGVSSDLERRAQTARAVTGSGARAEGKQGYQHMAAKSKAVCVSCGEVFEQRKDYHRLCQACWMGICFDGNDKAEAIALWRSWDGKCAYCGTDAFTWDHVVPQVLTNYQNQDTPYDVVPCCKRCNASKCADPVESWYKRQPFFDQSKLERVLNHTRGQHGGKV